jgi:hypothetical protein
MEVEEPGSQEEEQTSTGKVKRKRKFSSAHVLSII